MSKVQRSSFKKFLYSPGFSCWGPLFTLAKGSNVTTPKFSQALNHCLTFCGLDNTNYKSYSFRIGATDCQTRGLGRWKSDTFKEYLRSSPLVAPSEQLWVTEQQYFKQGLVLLPVACSPFFWIDIFPCSVFFLMQGIFFWHPTCANST